MRMPFKRWAELQVVYNKLSQFVCELAKKDISDMVV